MGEEAEREPQQWRVLTPQQVRDLLAGVQVRWWLSGAAALSHWADAAADAAGPIGATADTADADRQVTAQARQRISTDISIVAKDLPELLASLPTVIDGSVEAWGLAGTKLLSAGQASADPLAAHEFVHPVWLRSAATGEWILQINLEDGTDGTDGTDGAWVYQRDPRLQLPWSVAVVDIDGVPTGAPEMQLVWKALRPRPEDDIDKDAVLPLLNDAQRAWFTKALLSIHPHSSWAIHVRSPFAPAKASWNK